MKLSKCLAPLMLLLLPTEARLSQIHFKDISLGDLQSEALVVVKARYRKTAAEKKPNRGMQFDVEEVFKELEEQLKPKQRIEVWQKSAWAWGMVKQGAEATGVRASPIIPGYRMSDQRALQDKRSYILFLEPGVKPSEYVFYAQDGFEEPDQVPTHFSARVVGVVPLAEFGGKATPVDVDPRFVLTVEQVEVSKPGHARPGTSCALHSPARTLRTEPGKAVGQTLRFKLWKVEGKPPSYRLELE